MIKQLSLWTALAISLSFTLNACGGEDDPETAGTEAGTEVAGTMTAGTEVAGTMTAGTEVAGTMTAGTEVAGTMTAGTEVAGTMTAGTEIAGTEIAGTDMAGTDMAGTDMAGTDMAGTDMAGTDMAGTDMAGTDALMGACTNPADLGQIESLGTDGLGEAITGCVTMCFTADSPGCGTCLEGATGLSSECTACFVDVTVCTVMNCVGQCLDSASDACAQCRADNCNEAFIECSGVEPI